MRFLCGAASFAALMVLAASSSALAQAAAGRAVIQPLPGGERGQLNAVLARLARNPRDIEALIDAGKATLAAGDGDAAIGFYQKADALAPGNTEVKSGLAGAYVLSGDPISAIPLFDEAEKGGPLDAARTSDRGLAYDMIGDLVTAQRFYHEALIAGANDETSRRLALSQAVAGDRRGMEVTLGPLLQRQDKAAWRARAFALAILGQVEEAESITRSTMPPELAGAVAGYLRYMPKLTAAQQVAAANLGQFPRAAEIGQDDPRFAQFARTRTVLASADRSLTPTGPTLGRRGRADENSRDRRHDKPTEPLHAVAAAPVPPPAITPQRELVAASPVPAASLTPSAPAVVAPGTVKGQPAPVPVAAAPSAARLPANPVFASHESPGRPPGSSFDLKQVPATTADPRPTPARPLAQTAEAAPRPVPVPVQKARSLAEVFADLTPPSREAVPQPGAVDLRKLNQTRPALAVKDDGEKTCPVTADSRNVKPARGKPAVTRSGAAKTAAVKAGPAKGRDLAQCREDKPVGPTNPSRIWVQVATGRDRKALASDWRRMVKDDPEVFRGKAPFTSAWGQTNRLLTGPFESEARATAFMAQLRKAGASGAFAWSSPAGQVVDAIAGSK